MATAQWNGATLAESSVIEKVEGNLYFPPDDVDSTFLIESDHSTVCPWKGTARYYHVEVDGKVNKNAAWYYPDPKQAAENIKDHIAFWRGVVVQP